MRLGFKFPVWAASSSLGGDFPVWAGEFAWLIPSMGGVFRFRDLSVDFGRRVQSLGDEFRVWATHFAFGIRVSTLGGEYRFPVWDGAATFKFGLRVSSLGGKLRVWAESSEFGWRVPWLRGNFCVQMSYKVYCLDEFPTLRGHSFSFSGLHINITRTPFNELIHVPGLLDGCPHRSFEIQSKMGRIEQHYIDVRYVDAHHGRDRGLKSHNKNK